MHILKYTTVETVSFRLLKLSLLLFFPSLVYRTNMFGGWYMYSVPGGAVLKFVFDIYTWSVVKAVYLDIKFNQLREEE